MLQVYEVVIKKCCYKISNYYNSNKASPSTRMQNTPYISNYFFSQLCKQYVFSLWSMPQSFVFIHNQPRILTIRCIVYVADALVASFHTINLILFIYLYNINLIYFISQV